MIKALKGLDEGAENLDELASLAKAKLGLTLKEGNEAMQCMVVLALLMM